MKTSLCVPLKNIGQYGRFDYNLFSELFLEAEIFRPQVKLVHQAVEAVSLHSGELLANHCEVLSLILMHINPAQYFIAC